MQWKFLLLLWLGILLATAAAHSELRRIEHGRLFALRLPFDAAATEIELEDARDSAVENYHAALISVLAIGILLTTILTRGLKNCPCVNLPSRIVIVFFLISVIADMMTTISFFHSKGIVFELHPGIRLFAYAYGRTAGALLGKVVQAVGIIGVSSVLGRKCTWLLGTASCVYFIAAVYNVLA
jgi:hypothetical protein